MKSKRFWINIRQCDNNYNITISCIDLDEIRRLDKVDPGIGNIPKPKKWDIRYNETDGADIQLSMSYDKDILDIISDKIHSMINVIRDCTFSETVSCIITI